MLKFKLAYLVIILSAVFAVTTISSCGRNTDDINHITDDDDDDDDDDDVVVVGHAPKIFSVDISPIIIQAGENYQIQVLYGDDDRDITEICFKADYCIYNGSDVVMCHTGFCEKESEDVISCAVDEGFVCKAHTVDFYDFENRAMFSRTITADYNTSDALYVEQNWKYKFKDSKGNESNEYGAKVRVTYP